MVVEDYDERWPGLFQGLKGKLWPRVKDVAIAIEHVGSTSVPGLAAKPVIDMDIIVSPPALRNAVQRVRGLGYAHKGNLGIEGREAFDAPEGPIAHHLYVCSDGCLALRNHLLFRDHLRMNAEAREAYSNLKKSLAFQFGFSIEEYTRKKTEFILSALSQAGLVQEQLDAIRKANMERPTGDY